MADDEKILNDPGDEPIIVGAAVRAAGQKLEDIVLVMDKRTRTKIALMKSWTAEMVLASLKIKRAEKKGDAEGAAFWHEVRDYVFQTGLVMVKGTEIRVFEDWQKWPSEPWRRYNLRWESGWRRKAAQLERARNSKSA